MGIGVDTHSDESRRSVADDRRLDARAVGMAGGLSLAGWVVVLGLLSRIGWGDRWRRLFADLYPGYGSSLAGLIIGAIWAFIDGFVAGFGFTWLYNAFTRTRRPANSP